MVYTHRSWFETWRLEVLMPPSGGFKRRGDEGRGEARGRVRSCKPNSGRKMKMYEAI